MSQPSPNDRGAYRHFQIIPTRRMDNDVYSHVNNVVYYSYFDTVVNAFLINKGMLDIVKSKVIGLVVETACNYFSPITFPQQVVAGLRVAHLGKSSVRYEIGLFAEDSRWLRHKDTLCMCMSTVKFSSQFRCRCRRAKCLKTSGHEMPRCKVFQ
jgi:acyl-CoA thioester hydrolase